MSAAVVTVAIVCACLALPSGAMAAADTFTVTSSADPGNGVCDATCTVREALSAADDGEPERDTVNISLPAVDNTIVISSFLPGINEPTLIANTGLFGATISADGQSGVFGVTDGAPLELRGITVTAGEELFGSVLTVVNGNITIANSTISDSTGSGLSGGGAILLGAGSLLIENSTIAGNSTTGPGAAGGAIYTGSGTSTTIRRSTLSGNHADDGRGGAIYSLGLLVIESSTISGNYTKGASNGGGGIFSGGGRTAIKNSTIAGNEARGFPSGGGGIYTEENSPEPSLNNTIVADNTIGFLTGPVSSDLGTTNDTFLVFFSLVEASDSGIYTDAVPGSNIIGTDPQLGPLALHGGPTFTQRPARTSPVVDQGATDESTDQRLSVRPVDIGHVDNSSATSADGADIGAVELSRAEGPPVPQKTSEMPTPTRIPGATEVPILAPSTHGQKRCKRKKARKGATAAKKRCKKRRGGRR